VEWGKAALKTILGLCCSISIIAAAKQQVNPAAFISLGIPQNKHNYAIVVEKNTHLLRVFEPEGSTYRVVQTYGAITGKKQGDKRFAGDSRTPEGIYFIVGRKEREELVRAYGHRESQKYGPLAFVLDYPNIFDKRKRKTGSGIWIHGIANEQRILTPFDTEGCVALRNEDVLDLAQYVAPFETPVVIVQNLEESTEQEQQQTRENVLAFVESWRQSWETSNLEAYKAHYSDTFHNGIQGLQGWIRYKASLAKQRQEDGIFVRITDPKILAFRNDILVEFLQFYEAKGKKDFGRKFLYLKNEPSGLKIIAEKWYPTPYKEEYALALDTRHSPSSRSPQAMNPTSLEEPPAPPRL